MPALAKISTAYQSKGECEVCGDLIEAGDLYIRSKISSDFVHAEDCGESESDWEDFYDSETPEWESMYLRY